jgi:Trm5-related predicted tRNA methylase
MNRFLAFEKNLRDLEKQAANKLGNFYKENTEKQKTYIKKRTEKEEMYPAQLKLITDLDIVSEHTTHKQIELVKSLEDAQAVWLAGALDEEAWPVYRTKYYINQFPYESSVVMKNHLAEVVQSVLGNTPFLMRTFNLEK